MDKGDLAIDPRGLIFEAYRMEVGPQDCRTIFLDWALGRPADAMEDDIRALLERYAGAAPDHPMTDVLREGLKRMDTPPRRGGGARGRRDNGA
jgi:hypothetical protein